MNFTINPVSGQSTVTYLVIHTLYDFRNWLNLAAKNRKNDGKFLKPVDVPFLVQTYPCRPKKTHTKSGATVPLVSCYHLGGEDQWRTLAPRMNFTLFMVNIGK